MTFETDLRRFGPPARETASRRDALDYCARLTASHYENFSVVTWLTPREHRPAFQSIYAFCRWSDDLADEVGDPARSLELLAWWRGELDAMFEGRARHPVMIALGETVDRYGIPPGPFHALIDAFVQDQSVTDYATFDQLCDYCTGSADPVGRLVLYVAGAFDEENAKLSDATCTALQLANFWQDVSRDLDIGRIYLPREDRERFGVREDDLRARRFTPAFADLLKFEVARTRELFDRGRPLLSRIPGEFAVDVDLFSRGGLAILDRIEACGFDVLSARPSLGKAAKLGLMARAVFGLARARLSGGRKAPRPGAAPRPVARSPRGEASP
ncbi:squalene synthase HpnC [Planctomyces sp. SH-PL62]|uniref:squalene synthase HpnC n=1 Tax=Planctomyces sp. SH-PL62 TaxID=1636152 RepID=UPI00078E4867|nr:squalene synthase HpnC [Planctomyces sp. SH-PL62]AMV37593.1 All-trans-phytoene synthase [Planctomyces sp. SH-PL62]